MYANFRSCLHYQSQSRRIQFFNALSFYSMIALSSICFQKKSLFLETDALFRVFLQTLDMQRDIAGLGFRQFQIIFSF